MKLYFKHSSQFFKCIKNNLVNAELKDIKQGSSVDRVWCTSITVSASWSDSPFQKFVHKSNGQFHLSVFTHSKCVCVKQLRWTQRDWDLTKIKWGKKKFLPFVAFRNEVQQLNCTSNGTQLHTEFLKHGTVLILIANLGTWIGRGMEWWQVGLNL